MRIWSNKGVFVQKLDGAWQKANRCSQGKTIQTSEPGKHTKLYSFIKKYLIMIHSALELTVQDKPSKLLGEVWRTPLIQF